MTNSLNTRFRKPQTTTWMMAITRFSTVISLKVFKTQNCCQTPRPTHTLDTKIQMSRMLKRQWLAWQGVRHFRNQLDIIKTEDSPHQVQELPLKQFQQSSIVTKNMQKHTHFKEGIELVNFFSFFFFFATTKSKRTNPINGFQSTSPRQDCLRPPGFKIPLRT
jgi:hypothetical protein